jgi:DNA (cytosine-5)-methyltransferase 1
MRAIDLFCGWGGMTLGATLAGVEVVWAANHWQLAVDVHSRNHPLVPHACQDLRQADWTALPAFDLLLAAPACQGHSTASQPQRRGYHDAMRATAWSVVDCADVTQPSALIVENVPAFRRWRLYRNWLGALRKLGYTLTEQILDASQHGVPQRRRRLFVIGTRKRRPVIVAASGSAAPSFADSVDWMAPGWRLVRSASPGAQARIAAAHARGLRRCLVQHTTGHSGISLDEPIRTITTKDQWILVDGDRYRPLTLRELARGMSFPDTYSWPEGLARNVVTLGLGNAVCPLVGRAAVAAVREAA